MTQPSSVRRALLAFGLCCGVGVGATLPAWAAEGSAAAAPADGDVLVFRHATAPGGGDPPGFRLGDCSTQRNLDEDGRAQARRMGEGLRSRGLRVAAVWVSPWCRTRETAALAWPGLPLIEQAAFASFFGDVGRQKEQTGEARRLLDAWHAARSTPGVLVVVTHQVNITALTGVFPASGEGLHLRRGEAGWQVLGRLPPP